MFTVGIYKVTVDGIAVQNVAHSCIRTLYCIIPLLLLLLLYRLCVLWFRTRVRMPECKIAVVNVTAQTAMYVHCFHQLQFNPIKCPEKRRLVITKGDIDINNFTWQWHVTTRPTEIEGSMHSQSDLAFTIKHYTLPFPVTLYPLSLTLTLLPFWYG